MRITFHGAAQTVTGSMHLLEINGSRLLLECGLYQGRREDMYTRNRTFPFRPRDIDALILSHAHIDHSGNLPHLVKAGYRGPIFCTEATAHLTNIMLLDSGHIQEADALFVNKRRAERGEPPIEPLYTQEDAALVAMLFDTVQYGEIFEPVRGVEATLLDAGHILGSASVSLDIEEQGKRSRLWFSGDIGRRNLPLLRDPVLPTGAHHMIMEATYGDKQHSNPEIAYEELKTVLQRTIGRGGKVIIPAFAVGRTQELVYNFQRMFRNNEVPRVPVIVDSPLAVNASDIFRQHLECFDEETMELVKSNRHEALLGFELLTYTRSVEESKALNGRKDPMIIISASGMAESGRILHHLRNNIEDPKNTVLIVSWQSPYTLGRRLADREKRVKIFGEVYDVNAEVSTIGGLSAHAGQDLLTEYALAVKDTVREVYLVHAEKKPADMLSQRLRDNGMGNIHFPELHSHHDL